MFISKIKIGFLIFCLILTMLTVPASSIDYNVGVIPGHYIRYLWFSNSSTFTNIIYTYEVTTVSGKNVTVLQTISHLNGTMLEDINYIVWNVEWGTLNGSYVSGALPDIIAANLTQGDSISRLGILNVTRTENRFYFGLNRIVNIVEEKLTSVNTTIMMAKVYDCTSGMMLEGRLVWTDNTGTDISTFSVIETNIFTGEPIPEFASSLALLIFMVVVAIEIASIKRIRKN